MYVEEICLTNIRKFNNKKIKLKKGVNVIYGNNGSGKTTVLEALNIVSVGKSFKTNTQKHIIKEGTFQYNIKATTNNQNKITVQGEGVNKKIKVDDSVVKKITNHIGFLPTIYNTPDSILYQGKNNSERQRNINQTNCLLSKKYTEALKKFNTTLKQRNKALKLKQNHTIWDDVFIKNAIIIWKERKKNNEEINKEIEKIQQENGIEKKIEFFIKGVETDPVKAKKNLQEKEQEDQKKGRTTYGPHTDRITFFINKKSIKNHASQGEKSLCFSVLKKAEANIIKQKINKEPIILLDDIFSKLDKPNTRLITNLFLKTNQTIISHTEKINEKKINNISIN